MKLDFIDSHCHAHFAAYKDDMNEVVERSLANGVGMITIGTQSSTSRNAIELAEKYDGVWAAIGLHPNHLHEQEFFDDDELPEEKREVGKIKTRSEEFDFEYYSKLVVHPKVVAIGEFGLDYYHIPEDIESKKVKEDQAKAVKEQLSFASKFDKPVIIHCRDAHEDQIKLLQEEIQQGGLEKRGVIHSFTGTYEEAEKYIEMGFVLGLNGIFTFSKDLQKVIKKVPIEYLLIETDAPYLAPAPFRGKRNEPHYVKYIAQLLAEIKEIDIKEVAKITKENTIRVFGF